MCVILIAQTRRLSDGLLADAVRANEDGNGLAWMDGSAVRFEKDITLDRAQELAATVPMPYVFHARIATIGGIRPELCHPFALDTRVRPTTLRGRCAKGVLFHNGHWSGWRDHFQAMPAETGPWSDSRAMATLVADLGSDAIGEFVGDGQRVVLLTRAGVERFGIGWTQIRPGIFASNQNFCRLPLLQRGA